jgi:hypothetical protein
MSYEEYEHRLQELLENCSSASSCDSESEEEIDNVSQRSEESDSDQEGILDCLEEPVSLLADTSQSFEVRGTFYTSKDGTKWSKDCPRQSVRTRSENIITNAPGVKGTAKFAKTEIETWSLFITNSMLNNILTYTNIQIKNKRESCPENKEQYHMTDASLDELKAYIGLLYIAGLNRSNRQNLNDLWATDGTGVEIFRMTMSLQRFYFLQNSLRFDDKNTRDERKKTDNLAAIRDVMNNFVYNIQQHYVPCENLTIDEMLLSFRGRCPFRVYIPSKPAKYGIKIQALVDAEKFYILYLEVYAGKQPPGPFQLSNKAFDIVNRLVEPITKTKRNLTFDNWFTSYPLMIHLLTQHSLTSVGTVRKNKTSVPEIFKKGTEVNGSRFGFQKDITLVSYVPKKNKVVLVMSTLHHDQNIDESTGDKRKPEMITFYNKTKAGVDVVDELSATYDVSRNSKRWPMTIFYGILNMAAINGIIIYRQNNVGDKTRKKRRNYLRNLGLDLIKDSLRNRQQNVRLPRETRKRIADHLGEPSPSAPKKTVGKYVRCGDCTQKRDRKTKHCCSKCEKPICMEHANLVCGDCNDL